MQSTSEGCMNIAELANQLRREKIFITSERQQVQNLNEDVEKKALELLQVSWICSQQRQNLTNLLAARCEAESVVACQRASLLENTTFIDVYKVLNYKEANALAELLGWLRDSPHLMCLCLLLGEEHLPPSLPPALVAGLYGSCRSAGDRTRLLAVIRSLIKHQMAPLAEPRKLFRTGRGALASLYTVFRDGHTPARQFLIAALEGPVMSVLQEDEFYLDIDPDKSMERFSAADRLKKFGQPTSPEFATKVARYRAWVVQSLYNLTNQFICSLREHWSSFPASLAWILQQIVTLLKHHSRVSERELHALCTDVVLTQYVCAGVAAPDALGVADAGVSAVARSNLQQVAQLLQGLCLAKCQEVDPKARDLYSKFDRACVWSLVESALSGACAPAPPPAPAPPAPAAPRPPAHALLTHADAHCLVNYLKRISSKLNNNTPSVTSEDMSSGSGPIAEAAAFSESSSDSSSVSDNSVGRLMSLLQTVEPNYKSRLHDLLRRLPQLAQYRQSPQEYKEVTENGHTPKKGILAKVSKPRPPRSASPAHEERGDEGAGLAVVMLIKLPSAEDHEYIGLESEAKVLESYYGGSEAGDADDGGSALAVAAPTQKRTRFSVSHDEVSFGNTSDNLEAVSEAASNHSVTSSLELETEDQNDNLSDMVSANVSGRGSPNISGRETPSSQVTDGDAAPDATRRMPANAPISQGAANAQAKLLKQTRNDIEDKFCKFEIKKLLEGDETISIMSDTWSTDVLASDSETIGDGEQSQGAPSVASGGAATSTLAPDVSETASESAWSVDVLASDSDRNTEVDTDDCVSVAARSDSSWPRRASQPEELAVNKVLLQNGNVKRPEAGSPRHTSRPILPNRSGGVYLSATAAISRGGELDLSAAPYGDQRKSILVNGYPVSVMSCYAASASGPSADSFEYGPHSSSSALTESTLDGANSQSDATSQWVDDSFPPPQPSPERPFPSTSYDLPSTSKQYEEQDLMDRSLNSSESSFNHLSVSQYDRRFDSGIDTERQDSDSRSMITDLMTRMSSATISTSNLVNNITSRIVKSEIRTSIVSISSSRVDKRRELSNISLSTLSLNSGESASDRSSSQDVNSENVTERRVSPPPAKPLSTGAIPKSISFDATAEKSQRRRIIEDGLAGNLDELKHNVKRSGGSLLHKIRMFRQKARSQQNHHDVKLLEDEARSDDGSRDGPHETSEDILAKYRRKGSGDAGKRAQRRASDVPVELDNRPEGVVDLNDPEVFDSMKRRLRIVLSNPDLHCVDYVPNRCTSTSIVEWVRCLCWSGGAGGEWGAAGAAHVWRALATAGQAGRLAGALRSDLAARRPYLAYLAACRHALAVAQTDLHQQIGMVRVESVSLSRAAAAARTRAQLERGGHLRRLAPPPHGSPPVGGELMDEKATRLIATIKAITAEVKADPSWDGATSLILETVEMTVERAAFARIYLHVMFPNGDGDIARDQVFSEHIRRQCAGASAARLGVAARHLWAAPFPRAQAALRALAACRTPRDKLSCVMRCVTCIMAALSLTDGTAPSADDLTPALVYVILKVNPPSLLSTVDLVSALGGAALAGEALYWWTQFCACVAYIKTLDFARS